MVEPNLNTILDVSIRAGCIILQNGGETYRAEETMVHIAKSLGAVNSSCFVTPTVVMLTCIDSKGKTYTQIQRINERTINLGKIAQANEVSRKLAIKKTSMSIHVIDKRLKTISELPNRSAILVILSTAIASFFFSLLFFGTLQEALCAFFVGAMMRCMLIVLQPLGLTSFLVSVIGSTIITLLSGLIVAFGFVASSGNISISCLMSLVPGLAIVNAIRDSIAGDLVAGSARTLEAFIIAAALSIGTVFGLQ